jgi:hypothetical protein
MRKPEFKHDCDKCVFLDHFKGQDLYYHGPEAETVIARYSDDPASYYSGLSSVTINRYLARAHTIAKEKGYIK